MSAKTTGINIAAGLLGLFMLTVAYAAKPVVQIQPRVNVASNIYSSYITDSVKMEVICKEKVIYSAYCDTLGRFEFYDLPLNKTFFIKFSKPGFVSKMAEINTSFAKPKNLPASTPLLLQVSLIHFVRGKDYSFTETEPMIQFTFNAEGKMTFDMAYVKAQQAKVDAVTNSKSN